MIKMIADSSLPNLRHYFNDRFEITQYTNEQDLREKLSEHTLLLCRSTLNISSSLLFDTQISCVATVSSGTDHIVQDYPIRIIDAKGANARAVADYIIACVAYCQLRGYLSGLQVGIIGVGAVGTGVVSRLQQLGFTTKQFDPLRAMQDPNFSSCEWYDLLDSDLICVHANLQDNTVYPSRHLLNETFLSQLKSGTVIINAARGDIVDEKALLNCRQTLYYCTDVYSHEPDINPALIDYSTLCTPHIAGHSIEAKNNALQLVSQKIQKGFGQPMMKISDETVKIELPRSSCLSWQEAILSLYNPEIDTIALKQARNVSQTFLGLRQAHQFRHDFNCYRWSEEDAILSAALGKS